MINGLYIMIVLGLSITCIGLMIQSTLFQWMNVSKELLPGALSYDSIIFIGALFSALYNYESALLRAYGDSVTPLLFLILSAILNIVFDLVFVLIFHLGISGVVLATVIAQLICCLLCYFYMKKRLDLFSFNKEDFKIDFICIKENLKVGLPMAFFQSLLAISFLIVQSALNSLGSQEVAAYTAAYKMDSLMMQMLAGFGTAMSTYTAQNYGQHAFERIKEGSKSMLVITITLSIVVTIMAHLFNKQFMMLFVSKKEIEVIHLGMNYISFTSWFYFVLYCSFCFNRFRGNFYSFNSRYFRSYGEMFRYLFFSLSFRLYRHDIY